MHTATTITPITKYNGLSISTMDDLLAVEEPLEIRLEYGTENDRRIKNLSVTMRTPGQDRDLAIGFLFTEGMIHQPDDISSVSAPAENVVLVHLNPALLVRLEQLERHFYTTSSCGVCGKTSIDAVKSTVACANALPAPAIDPSVIYSLPNILRAAQTAFDATGGIHAAAIFDWNGQLLALREDVGRHNALDKLIGHFLQNGQTPLDQHILLLSGRASFELIQKAAIAGIRLVCAVGAPSSLAVETARSFGISLIGFLRGDRFNQYT